ncbi:sugar ABC transporter substrate-binding protein [Candidatus Galacturonibacter soehngenii]|uniref:Sugar ABC transporter substrate-binding protein n=1 Tax=Candidatus Galacturonatibacter soehngenii TaxID=2307010 RepID=A0A7V7UC82_9FIRM|nr:substrate-binding domain-containing protein [Candidatus Galacturonibacter soehngenii]KAB1438665.1 sugar ABC transporter substrate-binding protein [Candidatus Galacturonibacter soehngenii]
MKSKNLLSNKTMVWVLVIFLMIIIVLTGTSIVYLKNSLNVKQYDTVEYKPYNKHYAFIVDDKTDTFWDAVYKSAKAEGEKYNIFLEQSGKNLAVNYTKAQLLEIAIQSKVDGVIIEGDDSKSLSDLINTAVQKQIPVITILSDCTTSERQSFVGVNSYNMGQVYGEQVLKIAKEKEMDILVLMNSNTNNTIHNIIYAGIRDTLMKDSTKEDQYHLTALAINNKSTFGTEETVRDIFMNENSIPDIMICLDEVSTTSAYQAAVDYNKVGEVDIIGCYTSDTILTAIDREVINSTISIDYNELGKYCIDTLNEYNNTGHVSEYVSANINLITSENVGEYLIYDEETTK